MAPAATWWSPSASATIYSISSRLAVQDDAIYNFSGSVALGPDYTVSVKVEEGELGLLGTAMGELDLDSPALLVGFDVYYDSESVAYMDLSAGRKGDHDDFRDYASGTDLYPNGYGFESDDFMLSSRLVVSGDAIYDGGAAVALGPGNAVNVFVVESELGLLGAVKGELDLDSPALLIGFDVQYEGDNVAYMDLEARREATDSTDSDLDGNAPYLKLHLICTVLLLPM